MSITAAQDKLLKAPIDKGRLATRKGSRGATLTYLEAWDVIATANRIFGLGEWSRSFAGNGLVKLNEREFEKDGKTGYEVAFSCEYQVTVGDQFAADVGYGNGISYQSAIAAYELAVKEAVSDALKRCLRSWGEQFGNSLYDKGKTNAAAHHGDEDDEPKTTVINPKPAAKKPAAAKQEPAPAETKSHNAVLMELLRQAKKSPAWALTQCKKHGDEQKIDIKKVGDAPDDIKLLVIVDLQKIIDKEKKNAA